MDCHLLQIPGLASRALAPATALARQHSATWSIFPRAPPQGDGCPWETPALRRGAATTAPESLLRRDGGSIWGY
eukprot:15455385-Alexandrium_andersonii.AAC.1